MNLLFMTTTLICAVGWIKNRYDVIQINGDRAVIGIGNTVTSAINIRNIERV